VVKGKKVKAFVQEDKNTTKAVKDGSKNETTSANATTIVTEEIDTK